MSPSVALALLKGMPEAPTHAERLSGFYQTQAKDYDSTRNRLLPGRSELMDGVAARLPDGASVVDLGGGTGGHLEYLGVAHRKIARLHLVDLCGPLLAKARHRATDLGWDHLRIHEADACTWRPEAPVDAVICSFSLTMIPDWFRAIDNAVAMLRPGGFLAVVDFQVSRARPEATRVRHPGWMRILWPAWFAHDGVHPNPDHLPYLSHKLTPEMVHEGYTRMPWMPIRTPYYRFIGRR